MKKIVNESLSEFIFEQIDEETKKEIEAEKRFKDFYDHKTQDDHAFTPFPLCKELIQDAINAGADINSDKKIMVMHSPEIIRVLKKHFNLSKEAVFNRVHFFTTCPVKKAFAEAALGVNPRNIILDPAYKQKTDNFMNLHFDLIIGNPPFEAGKGARNRKLWYTFSKMCIDSFPKIIAYITPNNVISEKGENGKDLRDYIKKSNYGFIHIRNHTDNPFSDKGVDTCHWIIKRFSGDKVNPIIIKKQKTGVEDIRNSIIDKVIYSEDERLPLEMQNGGIEKPDLGKGNNELHFSGSSISKTNKPLVGDGVKKIVFPFSHSYHQIFYTDKPVGMLNLFMPVSSEEEFNQIRNYALHPLFRYVEKFWKKTAGYAAFVKNNMVPDLRFKKNWTVDEIYEHFGIEPEEIEEINKEIKEIKKRK